MEQTLVMIKPDGIKKGLIGEIIKRIEAKKLRIKDIQIKKLSKKQVLELYKDSLAKFPQIRKGVIEYTTRVPLVVFLAEGKDAIKKVRKIRGLSDPSKSPVGSIRRDYAGSHKMDELTKKGKVTENIMHSSGNTREVKFEIRLLLNGEK